MSKKMWNKIFKSKSQKPQPLAKINKRHSRGIYEEYQQLNDLLASEKAQLNFCNQRENENGSENVNGNGCGNGSINVFEQQPLQSSFNSLQLSEAQQSLPQQQQQPPPQQQLSTFSRVRNTFSLKRNSNSGSSSSSNKGQKNLPNAKSTAFNTENELQAPGGGQEEEEPSSPPPPPLTRGLPLPVPETVAINASDLTPCPCCSRTFNLNALRKHVVICEKTSKKRKIFDSSRQRREGTLLSTYVLPKNFGLPNAEKLSGVHTPLAGSRDAVGTVSTIPTDIVGSPLPTRRKSQTELVRSTARASVRRAGGGATAETAAVATSPAGEPNGVPARDRSLAKRIRSVASERCPHCERSFNVKAFDRHVEWCKEKAVQATIKCTNTQETTKAKERLDARKQYRPPNLKTKRSINRNKYSGNHEELLDAGDMTAPKPNLMSLSSMTSSVHSDNGLSGASVSSDKYDPFLSAKRQLEELCSPGTPPDEEEVHPTATPSISMSTSLTMPSGKAAPITPKPTPASNFRRTSSLRGPRRTPLLPSRPLFATNYRPTIQRGLSDEGPISTNFLKPEEYDEMPVRAACVNDFHSPRVVRRDTSSSNRKQLKLPQGVGGASETAAQAQPGGRNVAKTDSLAVFLKYEHELEQLNAKAAEVAAANQLNSKELKDKSNNLSKQNSAKSLTACSNAGQLPPLTPVTSAPVTATAASTVPAPVKENNEKRLHNNYQPIATPLRLEPIGRPATAMPAISGGVPASLTPIKLESIFGFGRPAAVSGGGEFIDPKLINACDNLHMSSGVASSEASSTPQQLSQSRSRSSSQSTITYERRQSGEARNLLKRKMRLGRNQFLYDASPEDADASSGCSADDEANRSSMEYDEQCWQQQQKQLLANPLPMVMPMGNMPTFDDFDFEEFLSSFENENDDEQFPLFKDCREFLLNRTTSRQRSFQKATSTPQQTATATLRPATTSSMLQPKLQPTKDSHAHRSNSNGLDEKHQLQQQLQRQQSNSSSIGSHEEKMPQKMQQLPVQRPADDQQKREIFISIETEANDHGRSPISPDSLRHMVGNSQTPIDVLQIENGNEPEHARFRKISDDTEDNPYVDAQGEHDDRASQLAGNASRLALSSSDSVQVNNAKNLIQQMQSEFRQMGEDAGASIRTLFIRRPDEQSREMEPEPVQQLQQQQQQQQVKASSPLTPSASADSDELSSLDGYPMSSSHSSRRGASSKLSSDSAYGSTNSPYSLSRQRSGDLQPGTPRNQTLLRPHTASAKLPSVMSDASTQAHNAYATLKARHRLYGGGGTGLGLGNGNTDGAESSSSGSEHSLTMATQQATQEQQQQQQQHNRPDSNFNYQQQQMQSQPAYNSNNNNNNNGQMTPLTPTTSQHSLLSNASATSLSSSTKMSKFCHECGGRFIIEHAKFCMDCGVRRMIL
ncbi:uncharacterized protein LOC117891853 isoform X3 [Drosophila subobscura]|uniref:uncharacterized protein LOC117891853 isoform X3 n=1 Tax=Drosophila subobscura TaxID=7241 RepID=UPI00155A0633|nr:uncharacterized protein LOC117891853 isoform X3 [Drosophila subobscura]